MGHNRHQASNANEVFENSDCSAENNVFETSDSSPPESHHEEVGNSNENQSNDHVFVAFSKAEEEILFTKLPNIVKGFCERSSGIFYMERYESFIYNNWPFEVKRGHLCHPRALALAGLGFHSLNPTPAVQCQVCLKIFDGLQSNSNPWILHLEASPDCYLVKLGQRDEADDYTIDQVTEMVCQKIITESELHLKEKEDILKQQLYNLKQLERKKGLK